MLLTIIPSSDDQCELRKPSDHGGGWPLHNLVDMTYLKENTWEKNGFQPVSIWGGVYGFCQFGPLGKANGSTFCILYRMNAIKVIKCAKAMDIHGIWVALENPKTLGKKSIFNLPKMALPPAGLPSSFSAIQKSSSSRERKVVNSMKEDNRNVEEKLNAWKILAVWEKSEACPVGVPEERFMVGEVSAGQGRVSRKESIVSPSCFQRV